MKLASQSKSAPARARAKSWAQKLANPRPPEIQRLERAFSDLPAGASMLISNPRLIDARVRAIPPGAVLSVRELRAELATAAGADFTCPLTTGIFLRIVAEAAWEQHQAGESLTAITPFWRAVDPKSPLARKLACGVGFVQERQAAEAKGSH